MSDVLLNAIKIVHSFFIATLKNPLYPEAKSNLVVGSNTLHFFMALMMAMYKSPIAGHVEKPWVSFDSTPRMPTQQ